MLKYIDTCFFFFFETIDLPDILVFRRPSLISAFYFSGFLLLPTPVYPILEIRNGHNIFVFHELFFPSWRAVRIDKMEL